MKRREFCKGVALVPASGALLSVPHLAEAATGSTAKPAGEAAATAASGGSSGTVGAPDFAKYMLTTDMDGLGPDGAPNGQTATFTGASQAGVTADSASSKMKLTADEQAILDGKGNYARRWRVENSIAEAVSFFNLNALSSPILLKVHFDVLMTLIADTLYTMLAQKLRGFEECDANKLYRHFVKGKGTVEVRDDQVIVTFPRRAHNPILRAVPWTNLPNPLPAAEGTALRLRFS